MAEMADVLGLFAPRPVVIVAGQQDEIFPIAGVQEAFAQLQRIYAAAGARDQCRLVVGPGGHRFYADLAWPELFRLMGW
jgi:pimeloyl-ACP methyl ester carboxylesterase